jgi:hypothetical protein
MSSLESTDALPISTPDTTSLSSRNGDGALPATSRSSVDWPEWRLWEIAEKYTDHCDYGDWKDDYANAVGMSRHKEL